LGLRIYKASAGSGKTFTLAKEYIKIALRSDYAYQNILAITFTVKATQEMKERILNALSKFSQGGKDDMLSDILKETDFSHQEIIERSGRVYSNMLHNYGRFEVSTLDSFFVRTVKSIAKELGLPINFEIELDHDKTMEAMVEKLFEEAKNNKPLRDWLNKYAEHKMGENKSWHIKRDIFNDGRQVFSEKYHQANRDSVGHNPLEGESSLVDIIADAQKEKKRIRKKAAEQCEKALALAKENGLSAADFRAHTFTVFERKEKVLEGTAPSATFHNTVAGSMDWYTKSAPQAKVAVIDGIASQLSACGIAMLEEITLYSTYDAFLKKIFIYGILDYLNTLLVSYRDEKNLLLLSDLSALLSSLIGNNDAPFIFEKAGSRYQHIFIDEFQDTSDLQWKNVLPLVLNALGNGDEVLIVGDVKQSIYRWRGGNLNLLLEDIKKDLVNHYSSENSDKTLNTNYRSDKAVVEFNNQVFSHIRDNLADFTGSNSEELLQKAYKEIEQVVMKKSEGFVSVNFIQKDHDYEEEMSEWLINAIKDCQADGFSYRDMLILVETKVNAHIVAQILHSEEIKVITDRSLLLRNSEKVLFLISCTEWLSDTRNQVAQCQMLYLYRVIFEIEADLHDTFNVNRENWLEDFIATMPNGFIDQLDNWKSKPVYEALEDIIYFFGLHEKADGFIQKFQDELLVLMEKGETSLEDMLKWWKANRDELSIGAPESEEAIKIMTVHKSKGLESPIVFYPFSKRAYNAKGLFWTDQIPDRFSEFKLLPLNFSGSLSENEFSAAHDLELSESILERLNVHYVAFTRAKSRLYVCGTYNPKLKKPLQNGKIKTLEQALDRTLEVLGICDLQADDISKTYTYGKKEKRKADNDEDDHIESKPLRAYPSHPYTNKLNLKEGSKRFFELREEGLESDRQRGLIIHSLLESLDQSQVHEKQIEKLQNEGIINADEVQFVRDTFSNLMKDATFQSFFDPEWESFVEREILLDGKSFRPDRVIVKGTAAKVIDYKSELQKQSHTKQVSKYAELLEQMGYTDIEKYLVYTISQEIVKVS